MLAYGTATFAVLIVPVKARNILGPLQGASMLVLPVTALATYLLFAAVAFLLDIKLSERPRSGLRHCRDS